MTAADISGNSGLPKAEAMEPQEIAHCLDGIPSMEPAQGVEITRFIRENQLSRCLELGFAHGVGTAYLAHAVAGMENGRVVTIDREEARSRNPDIHTALRRVGVPSDRVEIYFEPTSYTWRLMRFLEAGRQDDFDFIYIDGAHTWAVDGLAFYLCAQLLRPGGWILFDDLDWTLATSSVAGEPWVQALPIEERETPQVRKIWELLVKSHPSFDRLIDKGNWGYAHKSDRPVSRSEVIQYRYHPLVGTLRKMGGALIRHYRSSRRADGTMGRNGVRQSSDAGPN